MVVRHVVVHVVLHCTRPFALLTRGQDSRFYGLDIPSATSTKESPRIDTREPVEYKNVV
jgi:hypothetical protein